MTAPQPNVTAFLEPVTSTLSYVVADVSTGRCAVIDPVLDYDAAWGRTATTSADALVDFVNDNGWTVDWVLDTHVHADHMTAMPHVQARLGGRTGIGEKVAVVQETFKGVYNLPDLAADGSQFDRLFADGDTFAVGGIEARVIHTPGHTPACVSYLIGDALFVGDMILMPDFGTARCDFPGGDAATLFRSAAKVLALPPEVRMFVCHDYGPGGREIAWETTVGEQRRANVHVHVGTTEADFVRMRTERDRTLALPNLMLAALQVNVRGGRLPSAEGNGVPYLKIPLNRF